jgi:hypothetical protein
MEPYDANMRDRLAQNGRHHASGRPRGLSRLESNIRKKLSPAEADSIVLAAFPETVKHPFSPP